MNDPLIIDYYSDILCVWAWIAQRRIDELHEQWGERIQLRYHCVDVFGDTRSKFQNQWSERGGVAAFAEHVQHSAAQYEETGIHPQLWIDVQPTTSATAHLLLKATELTVSHHAMIDLADAVRRAFFVNAVDISQLEQLMEIAENRHLPGDELRGALLSGQAMAALLSDYTSASQQGIKGSPSWVMNDGRQILYGNVGYRILHANVEELLRHPEQEASWC